MSFSQSESAWAEPGHSPLPWQEFFSDDPSECESESSMPRLLDRALRDDDDSTVDEFPAATDESLSGSLPPLLDRALRDDDEYSIDSSSEASACPSQDSLPPLQPCVHRETDNASVDSASCRLRKKSTASRRIYTPDDASTTSDGTNVSADRPALIPSQIPTNISFSISNPPVSTQPARILLVPSQIPRSNRPEEQNTIPRAPTPAVKTRMRPE